MKRIEMAIDYAEFLIRCKMALINIEKECNKNNFDVAKFMATELKITAQLLENAIDKKILTQRS